MGKIWDHWTKYATWMDLQYMVGNTILIFIYMMMDVLINDGGKRGKRIKEKKSQMIKMFLQKIIN